MKLLPSTRREDLALGGRQLVERRREFVEPGERVALGVARVDC